MFMLELVEETTSMTCMPVRAVCPRRAYFHAREKYIAKYSVRIPALVKIS